MITRHTETEITEAFTRAAQLICTAVSKDASALETQDKPGFCRAEAQDEPGHGYAEAPDSASSDCTETLDESESGRDMDITDLLFFDIETTGLSADTSCLYLIGCLYCDGRHVISEQFFAEDPDEEALLIDSLDELISDARVLVHFNGQTFDIPYIDRKRTLLQLNAAPECISFDIFRYLKPLKSLFRLSSMSQKSLEVFCGLRRMDIYDGGELIDFYKRYLAITRLEQLRSKTSSPAYSADLTSGLTQAGTQTSKELLDSLLLHNFEDVLGMLTVAQLTAFVLFFGGDYTIESASAELVSDSTGPAHSVAVPGSICPAHSGAAPVSISPAHSGAVPVSISPAQPDAVPTNTFYIRLRPLKSLPSDLIQAPLSVRCSDGHEITVSFSTAGYVEIAVPILQTELRLYYPDYRNYLYLPGEDTAIHKSIAGFMDRSLTRKCTPANCYTRHSSAFLPIPGRMHKETACEYLVFKRDIHDRMGYISLDEICRPGPAPASYVEAVLDLKNI